MPDTIRQADGARVLADLNALRAIGAYKTGVHKPTFSEPHARSLEWLANRLPEAGLKAAVDGERDRNDGGTVCVAIEVVGLAGGNHVRVVRVRHIGYLEAHIEQGQTLQSGGLKIVIVTSIVGIW